MTKLNLTPNQSNYSFTDNIETLQSSHAGGFSRYQKDLQSSAYKLNLEFTLDGIQYEYFLNFYNVETNFGVSSFTMDLILDTSSLLEYTCYFIPGTIKLNKIEGRTYSINFEIEVIPYEISQEEEDLVYVFDGFTPNSSDNLDIINKIINTDIPDAIGDYNE